MFYELKLENGESYKLRMNSKSIKDIEDKNGSLLDLFNKMKISDAPMLLYYLIKDYNHGFGQEDGYKLYDQLVDEGKTYEDILNIIMEGMIASGFFKKEQLNAPTKK